MRKTFHRGFFAVIVLDENGSYHNAGRIGKKESPLAILCTANTIGAGRNRNDGSYTHHGAENKYLAYAAFCCLPPLLFSSTRHGSSPRQTMLRSSFQIILSVGNTGPRPCSNFTLQRLRYEDFQLFAHPLQDGVSLKRGALVGR